MDKELMALKMELARTRITLSETNIMMNRLLAEKFSTELAVLEAQLNAPAEAAPAVKVE